MKSRWLSAAILAVSVAVSACGGTEETVEPAQVSDPGIRESRDADAHSLLLNCDEEGLCPTGYYCDPGWVCRRGVGRVTSQKALGAADSSSLGGTCQENCTMQCNDLYPEDSTLRFRCIYSCIASECGGADFPLR